ncbi:UNVERIFIED_CONTAM: hypothetical protein NCL1_33352 [Trichonephila clavipes]
MKRTCRCMTFQHVKKAKYGSEDDPLPKIAKCQRARRKVMYAVFIRIIKFEGQKTATANWYTTKCLPDILQEVNVRRLMLHHDSASSHTAGLTFEFFRQKQIKVIEHPPYYPDLANLRRRRFHSEEDIDVAINAFFHQFQEMKGFRHLICGKFVYKRELMLEETTFNIPKILLELYEILIQKYRQVNFKCCNGLNWKDFFEEKQEKRGAPWDAFLSNIFYSNNLVSFEKPINKKRFKKLESLFLIRPPFSFKMLI